MPKLKVAGSEIKEKQISSVTSFNILPRYSIIATLFHSHNFKQFFSMESLNN